MKVTLDDASVLFTFEVNFYVFHTGELPRHNHLFLSLLGTLVSGSGYLRMCVKPAILKVRVFVNGVCGLTDLTTKTALVHW